MTVETKGIALAQAIARYLDVPFVRPQENVQRLLKVRLSQLTIFHPHLSRVSKMELPTRALKKGSKVLIVDDFMKGGGTLTGMEELVKEFEGTIAGVCVLCEADFDNEKLINNYLSLVKISEIDTTQKIISG